MSESVKTKAVMAVNSRSKNRKILRAIRLLAFVLCLSTVLRAQQTGELPPAGSVRNSFLSKPRGIAREVAAASRDFATFRDPRWSLLTIAQIGAASADAVTSLNNFHSCPNCIETGPGRIFIGSRPDAHKYIIAGILEVGIEAVTAHYFQNHGPTKKWYWRALWSLPQSFSLYEHTRASQHNTALNFSCDSRGVPCR